LDESERLKRDEARPMHACDHATVPLLDARIDAVSYPGQGSPCLRNIRLRLFPGEFIVLTGTAESGKSTLCRCLSGVIPLFDSAEFSGEVTFCGRSPAFRRLPELAGEIGLVSREADDQLFCATVEEDLAFGPCSLLVEPERVRSLVRWSLELVGLSGYEKRRIETLSGGEAQRVAIAAALTPEPRLLILDRGTDQLDPDAHKSLYEGLRKLCIDRRTTVLTVDERALESVHPGDRHLILEGGTLIYDGPPKEIRGSGRGCSLRGPSPPKSYAALPEHARQPASDRTDPRDKPKGAAGNCAAISVRDLWFRYPGRDFILRGVSLEIERGGFVALAGKNGTGKTTLAKHFNGLLRPYSGCVELNGTDIRQFSPGQPAAQVGYLSQQPHLQVCTGSVREEIGFSLKTKGLRGPALERRVDLLLEKFDLSDVADVHPYRLTRSRLQKMAVASCLASDPPVLVMDEPTSGLSHPQDCLIMDLLRDLHAEGRTILVITHDLGLVRDYCSDLIVMESDESRTDASQVRRTDETVVCL
jgi:energy-coupling factor transport system ATP-binding protein